MKIVFNQIEPKKLDNFKGGEKYLETRMFTDENNKIMKATLIPGASIGLHTHETSSEIIYILSGHGVCICEGAKEELKEGDCHYCKKGAEHTLRNESDVNLVFFAVVPEHK